MESEEDGLFSNVNMCRFRGGSILTFTHTQIHTYT